MSNYKTFLLFALVATWYQIQGAPTTLPVCAGQSSNPLCERIGELPCTDEERKSCLMRCRICKHADSSNRICEMIGEGSICTDREEKLCPMRCGLSKKPVPVPFTMSMKEACLPIHNELRSRHKDTPSLMYDESLERAAQEHAQYLAKCGKVEHTKDKSMGENVIVIYSQMPSNDAKDVCEHAVNEWYNEMSRYNFNEPPTELPQGECETGFGNFTQLVWCSTTRVGVGIERGNPRTIIDEEGKEQHNMIPTYVVARYLRRGNVKNQFEFNVKELKSECQESSFMTSPTPDISFMEK